MVAPRLPEIAWFPAGSVENPYPDYAILREHWPIYYDERFDFWAVARFDDVQAVARDWQRFSNTGGVDLDRTGDSFGPNFLDMDPPRHRAVRGALQAWFAPLALRQRLEQLITDEVRRLMALLLEGDAVDFAEEFAWALPLTVISLLLGFPMEDRTFLRTQSIAFAKRVRGETEPPQSSRRAGATLHAYVADLVAHRRKSPRDDAISHVAGARVDGKRLPITEVVGNCLLMYIAGTETTSCLLTNALVLFDRYPDQWSWLKQNRDHVADAIEEILRFDSPVQHLIRTSTTDVKLRDQNVPAGSTVALLYGAANRDHARWPSAETLDLGRVPKRHLAFGEGIHHCIGAPLARLEAQIALSALLESVESFSITGPPRRLPSHLLRGFEAITATFVPARQMVAT